MANEGVLVGGDYTIQAAGNVNIQANGTALNLNALASPLGAGGLVALSADNAVTIACDQSLLAMAGDGANSSIALLASAGGSITHAAGPPPSPSQLALEPDKATLSLGPPVVGQQIVLEPAKITLSVGPPGVGASIELTAEGITLKFALWSVTINAQGITLAAGTNAVSVEPEGISVKGLTVSIQGMTQTTVEGLQTQISGTAMTQVQGGITMLG
jgi:hypothetical protein